MHKSGHHFDLINWWLAADPVEVAAMGQLAFYGDKAGKKNGWARDYIRARGSAEAAADPFALDIEGDELLKSLYVDAEGEDGYHRDRNVSCATGLTTGGANLLQTLCRYLGLISE